MNVLSFIDQNLPAKHPWAPGANTRQLAIDGAPFGTMIPVDHGIASPLVDTPGAREQNVTFLRSLLGGEPADPLRAGRIGLQFCGVCLDSSCGTLLAADLVLGEETVAWSRIGYEAEKFWVSPPRRRRWIFGREDPGIPPDEWWTPDPFEPELWIEFARGAYTAAVQKEIERVEGRE